MTKLALCFFGNVLEKHFCKEIVAAMPYFFILFVSFFFVLMLSALLYCLRSKAPLVLPGFYCFIAVYTYLGYDIFSYALDVPFDFFHKVDRDAVVYASCLFVFASAAFCLGALLPAYAVKGAGKGGLGIRGVSHSIVNFASKNLFFLFLLSLVSPLLLAYSFGFSEVFFRHGYLSDERFLFGMMLARVTLPFSCLAASFIPITSLRYACCSINFLVLFGITSRAMLLVIFFCCVGSMLRRCKIGKWNLVFASILILLSSAVALEFRQHPLQGVFPSIYYLLTEGVSFSYFFDGINYVASYSVALLAYMISGISYPEGLFFASINPLPSFLFDSSVVARESKISYYIPYTAIGELYVNGWLAFLSYYFVFGVVFSFLDKISLRISSVLFVLNISFLAVFSFMSVQYNLRGATRMLYYALFFYSIFWFFCRFLRKERM